MEQGGWSKDYRAKSKDGGERIMDDGANCM